MTGNLNMIYVAVEDDDLVEIRVSSATDESLRRSFQRFWGSDLVVAMRAESFRVPMSTFIEKMPWLRSVWAETGGNVELAPDVVDKVKRFQAGANQFHRLKTLSSIRHKGARITVPHLSSSIDLTDQQHENVSYLLDMDNGANFSVPGAGKTLTALAVWQVLRSQGRVGNLLVICPRAAFESWEYELRESLSEKLGVTRFEGEILGPDTQVAILNYEQLENNDKVTYLKYWLASNKGLLVLDEAHRIKGGERSVRWRAAKSVAESAQRVDLLTGTPMPQGPSDLKSLFSASWTMLTRRDIDERHLPNIRRNTIFVRTTKGELNLPPVEFQTVKRPPTDLQREILDALADKYIGTNFLSIADSKNLAKRGKAVMTALAAASNPALLARHDFAEFEMGYEWPPQGISESVALSELIDNYQRHEVPWKIKYTALRVEEMARRGEKVLVWSNFVGTLASLNSALRKFNPALVFGGTASEEREAQLSKFRNDPSCNVLIANPQTLGEGISLHKVCHAAIFIDRTYNAGLYLQAIDRIHRLGLAPGQRTSIEVLITEGTVDERVALRLESKVKKLASFLQDEHLVAASIPAADELSPEEILGLNDEDFADIASYWGIPS